MEYVEQEELDDKDINVLAVRDTVSKEIIKYIKREEYESVIQK